MLICGRRESLRFAAGPADVEVLNGAIGGED